MIESNTATIRELRTDFRAFRRRLEEHGEVVVTDRSKPAFIIRSLPAIPRQHAPLPDYYSRLLKRQPTPLSADETRQFWEKERG